MGEYRLFSVNAHFLKCLTLTIVDCHHWQLVTKSPLLQPGKEQKISSVFCLVLSLAALAASS